MGLSSILMLNAAPNSIYISMKVNLLALDSASAVCGVAALQSADSNVNLISAEHEGSAQHAEHILPLIEQCLGQAQIKQSELQAVAFAQGPGGFTGLRVACGVAQGIAYAVGAPVIPVSSLLAIAAQQEPCDSEVIEVVVVDARMQEIYVGAYQRTTTDWYSLHKPVLLSQEALFYYLQQLIAQQQQLNPHTRIRVSGDALDAFADLKVHLGELDLVFGNTHRVQVATIAKLALTAYQHQRVIEPALAAPLYVRNRVAFTIAEREQGLGGNPSALWQAVQVSPMLPAHLEHVAYLEQQLQADPWSTNQFQQSLAQGHWAWVAIFEGQVVAYAVVMPTLDEAELLIIGVAPAYQRQGIAQQLLCYAEQYARAQGCVKMHLEVRDSNYAARELYEGAGYLPVGLRKDYYKKSAIAREAAVLYTKVLA